VSGPHRIPGGAALFLRLDGKDYRPGLWQLVRPAGDMTPRIPVEHSPQGQTG
jgi:RNA ligase